MAEIYTFEVCKLIKNQNGLTFYKLITDGTCQFDKFIEEISRVEITRKKLSDLISRMGCFGDYMMPKKYVRHIKDSKIKDVYEFKKDDIRIYVQLKKPDVYIILGGSKSTQEKDIDKVIRIAKQLQHNNI